MKTSTAAFVFIQRVFSDGKILGVSRKDNHDDWGLPGGKCEGDEYPGAAAIRECREETGVEVSSLHEIFRAPARTPGRVAIIFRAESWAKTGWPQAGEGLVDWITWADLQRGSFGDFYRIFQQVIKRHETHILSLVPLVARLAYEERPRHEVENDCVDFFNIGIDDAIRLVAYAARTGVIEAFEGYVKVGKKEG